MPGVEKLVLFAALSNSSGNFVSLAASLVEMRRAGLSEGPGLG